MPGGAAPASCPRVGMPGGGAPGAPGALGAPEGSWSLGRRHETVRDDHEFDFLMLGTTAPCAGAVSVDGMESVEAYIAKLPKVELHVHLVGSASVPTVLALARRHPGGEVPTTEEELRKFYEFRDFAHFIDVYRAVSGLITEPEDIADLVRGVARDLAAQNVRY